MPHDDTHNGNDAPQSALSGSLRKDGARVIERLDADELAYFQLNKVQGLPRARCEEMLGWSKAHTENVRRRLNRHLRELRRLPRANTEARKQDLILTRCPPHGNSRKPFYAEQLPSGRRVWSLSPTHSKLYVYPNLPIYRGLLKGEAPIMRMHQLERELASEQTKLDRLVTEAREIAAEVFAHTTELSKLKNADEDSVLQPDFPARVGALEKLLTDTKVREQAFTRVVAKQREVVDPNEVRSRRILALTSYRRPENCVARSTLWFQS